MIAAGDDTDGGQALGRETPGVRAAGGQAAAAPGPGAGSGDAQGSGADQGSADRAASRGADLARNALDAARARNAAVRAARAGRRFPRRTPREAGSVGARMARTRWSGPGPDKRRDPQAVGDTLKNWLSSVGTGTELAKAALFTRWTELVGAGIADHCAPESLVDGQLVLAAESTAWATQLRMMAPQLVQRINAEIGRGTVTRIRAKGPTGPSWRFGNRHVPGRGPRDTYG